MAIGKQVRKYRKKAGWTLERLAELSGVETGTIGALEARDSKRSEYFPALAKAFGLSLEQMADETTDHPLNIINGSVQRAAINALEPGRPYLWPFKDLKPHEWDLLNDDERQNVETIALMLIRARADPKHQAPAKTIASAQST